MKKILILSLSMMNFLIPLSATNGIIRIETFKGESFEIALQETDSVGNLKQHIEALTSIKVEDQILSIETPIFADDSTLDSITSCTIFVNSCKNEPLVALWGGIERDYYAEMTSQEKRDVAYIITNLADRSLTTLHQIRHELEKVGERIDQIHPLNFLVFAFTDEKLKVAMHNIKKRGGPVWKNYIDDFGKSLQDEFDRGNLNDDIVNDFANRLELKPELISSTIQKNNWSEFISLLIKHIPRKGNPDRYDM